MHMVRSFQTALSFLTIFRVPIHPPPSLEDVGRAAWAFPLVGAIIGLILVGADRIFSGHLPAPLSAVLVVGLWVVVTGGLHLDGWADCGDSLPVSASPQQRLAIMKDSRLGAFGALALILILAVKTAAVASENLPLTMLFLSPVIGRGAMVVVANSAVHRGGGMAAGFIAGLDRGDVKWAVALTLGPAMIAGWRGLAAAGIAVATAFCFRRFSESRLNAVNGDVIGASCVLSEAVALVTACWIW